MASTHDGFSDNSDDIARALVVSASSSCNALAGADGIAKLSVVSRRDGVILVSRGDGVILCIWMLPRMLVR